MTLRSSLVGTVLLIAAGSAHAAESGLECAFRASSDYVQQKTRLFQSLSNIFSPSVEYTISQHRLVEDFCLRYTRCFFDDPNGWLFRSSFATCVERQSKQG